MVMHHPSRRNLLLALGAAAAGAGLAASPARASMLLDMDLGELTQKAERIVVGEVTGVRSAWDSKRERILTTVELRVAEAWKGQMPGDGRITIVQPGGVADGIEMRV